MKRQDDLAKNRENYAKQLWNLKRQGVEDARKKALADAQVKWYGSREEDLREIRRHRKKFFQLY